MDKKTPVWLQNKIIIPVIISSGIFLRFWHLGSHSFWCDEFLAISLARLNLSDMTRWVIRNDAHPPLFYGIVHFWMKIGKSEFILRMGPFLFGVAALIIFYFFLKRFRKENYVLPLALFTFSPAAVIWSQIVKSYSLLTLLTLLSAYSFFVFRQTKKPFSGVAWFLTTTPLLYLHNYGVLVFAAEIIVALLPEFSFSRKIWLPFATVIFLSYLPYFAGPVFSQIHLARNTTHSVTNPILRMIYVFYYFVFGETLHPFNLKFTLPGSILFGFFFFRGLLKNKREDIKLFSVVLIATGFLMVFIIPSTIPQNLVHLQPFFLLVVSSGINDFFKKRRLQFLFALLLWFFLLPSLFYLYQDNSLQYHSVDKLIPYRQFSQKIKDTEKTGDVIIFTKSLDLRLACFLPPASLWHWYYNGALPLLEVSEDSATNLSYTLDKILKRYQGFWLLMDYNGGEQLRWNQRVKDLFFSLQREGILVKTKEEKCLLNESFLAQLSRKPHPYNYFLEVYYFQKKVK